MEKPDNYLNQTVDVEILEPLYGPSRPEDLARAEYGQVEVRFPEGMSETLSLVPAAFKAKTGILNIHFGSSASLFTIRKNSP